MNTCRFPNEDRPFLSQHAGLTGLLVLLGLALLAVSIYSLATHTLLYPADQALADQFKAAAKALPAGVSSALTWLANLASVGPSLVVLIFAYHWLRRKCDDRFTLLLMSYGIGMMFFFLLALGFNRQRPSLPGLLARLPFPSFPSGHMIQNITLLAVLLYLYLPRVRSQGGRVFWLLLALAYLALVAYDRLILDAHYLTDVLAGAGIGLFWAVLVLYGFERYHVREVNSRQLTVNS